MNLKPSSQAGTNLLISKHKYLIFPPRNPKLTMSKTEFALYTSYLDKACSSKNNF